YVVPVGQNAPAITIRATPLVTQADPILDVAVLEANPPRVIVLGRTAVTIQEFANQRWSVVQSLRITSPNPLPRDARGRIFLRKERLFDAYLPGLACHSTNSAPLAMSCAPSEDPWPLQAQGLSAFFSPARNFFPGALIPGIGKQNSAPPFYSAAAVPRANYSLWIFAGLDGQVHLLDGINQQILGKVHWGSNVAAVHPTCRPDALVLACAANTMAATRPHYGGTLRVGLQTSAQTFDPTVSDAPGLRSLMQLVFETLVKLDDRGRPQPLLAASWQVEPGNQRWRFQVRNGVIFSDGIPVDANVAAASLRLANPEWKVFALGDLVMVETSSPVPNLAAELALPRNSIT